MVFAHGFGCDQNMWRFVAPEGDFRVVLFDHVGAGGSYDKAKYSTLQGYADDLVELGRALGLKDAVVMPNRHGSAPSCAAPPDSGSCRQQKAL